MGGDMKKVVIFGTSGVAKELCFYLENDGYGEVMAYTLNQSYCVHEQLQGKKIIAYEELGNYFQKDEIVVLVAIGYSQMNNTRKAIIEMCEEDGWEIGTFIHSSVLNLTKEIGVGNIVFPHVELRLDSVLGKGNIIGAHAIVSHDTVIGDYNYFAGSNHIGGEAVIGNHNFGGILSVIGDCVQVGDYNLLGAGICLSKCIDNHVLMATTPARERKISIRGMDLLLRHGR